MTSSIGLASQSIPHAPQPFPDTYVRGSTSGIGGQSTISYGRYDPVPTHHFQYKAGSSRFIIPGRGRVYSAKGTWGKSECQKYNIRKTISGSAGYINQSNQLRPNKSQMVLSNIGRVVKPAFLPRGGNVMRVIGSQGDGDISAPANQIPQEPKSGIEPESGDKNTERRNAVITGAQTSEAADNPISSSSVGVGTDNNGISIGVGSSNNGSSEVGVGTSKTRMISRPTLTIPTATNNSTTDPMTPEDVIMTQDMGTITQPPRELKHSTFLNIVIPPNSTLASVVSRATSPGGPLEHSSKEQQTSPIISAPSAEHSSEQYQRTISTLQQSLDATYSAANQLQEDNARGREVLMEINKQKSQLAAALEDANMRRMQAEALLQTYISPDAVSQMQQDALGTFNELDRIARNLVQDNASLREHSTTLQEQLSIAIETSNRLRSEIARPPLYSPPPPSYASPPAAASTQTSPVAASQPIVTSPQPPSPAAPYERIRRRSSTDDEEGASQQRRLYHQRIRFFTNARGQSYDERAVNNMTTELLSSAIGTRAQTAYIRSIVPEYVSIINSTGYYGEAHRQLEELVQGVAGGTINTNLFRVKLEQYAQELKNLKQAEEDLSIPNM